MARGKYPLKHFNALLKKWYDTWISEGRKDLTTEELDAIFEEAEYSKSTKALTLNQDQTLQEVSNPTSSRTSLYEVRHNYIQPLSQGIHTSCPFNTTAHTVTHLTCCMLSGCVDLECPGIDVE